MASTVTADVEPVELWRTESAAGCRLELINPLGGVVVDPGAAGNQVVVRGPASRLVVSASPKIDDPASSRVLTVEPGDSAGSDGADVAISVPAICHLTVRTQDGTVQVDLGTVAAPISVETTSGAIDLAVAPDADATIALATSGEITVDFSISIDFRYHEEPAKHGQIVLGDGGTAVRLVSRRGTVSVLRSPAGDE